MDFEHDHPLQSRRLNLDDPIPRRRALAASANVFANSFVRLRAAGHDPEIGVPFPRHATPTSVRRWAEALERANGTEELPRPGSVWHD